MRVTFNAFPDTLLGRLQSLGSEQNKSLTQLSTGQRIAAPSDDAPAMQRVLNLRTEKKQNQQFYRNATDGLERSKVTFSTFEQLKDLLVRSSELAANLSGASSDQEYKAKAAEIDQLIQQGVNLGNTKLRGSYLFSGESTEVPPFTTNLTDGKISSVGYQGSPTIDHLPRSGFGFGLEQAALFHLALIDWRERNQPAARRGGGTTVRPVSPNCGPTETGPNDPPHRNVPAFVRSDFDDFSRVAAEAVGGCGTRLVQRSD